MGSLLYDIHELTAKASVRNTLLSPGQGITVPVSFFADPSVGPALIKHAKVVIPVLRRMMYSVREARGAVPV